MAWTDERRLPPELQLMLNDPKTPGKLCTLIMKAKREIDQQGAVTYTTKANIEAWGAAMASAAWEADITCNRCGFHGRFMGLSGRPEYAGLRCPKCGSHDLDYM